MTITEFTDNYILNFYSYDKHITEYEFYAFVIKRDTPTNVICRHQDRIKKIIVKQLDIPFIELEEKFKRVLAHNCLIEFGIENYDALNTKNDINKIFTESI